MLEKASLGVIYTRKLFKQIEQIVLYQARWCNWLTRRPLKAESTGSSPVRAISHHMGAATTSRPFRCKEVIFQCGGLFWQVGRRLATEPPQTRGQGDKGTRGQGEGETRIQFPLSPLLLVPLSFCVSVAIRSTPLSPTAPARVGELCKTRSPGLRWPRARRSAAPSAR